MYECAKLMRWKGSTSVTQESKPFALRNLFPDEGYIHVHMYMIHMRIHNIVGEIFTCKIFPLLIFHIV